MREESRKDLRAEVEVEALKRPGHVASKNATQSADKINKLLRANGITLKIHIATKGENHA